MNKLKLFELELFAKLLRAFVDAKDTSARTVAKKWLDIVEEEIAKEEAQA